MSHPLVYQSGYLFYFLHLFHTQIYSLKIDLSMWFNREYSVVCSLNWRIFDCMLRIGVRSSPLLGLLQLLQQFYCSDTAQILFGGLSRSSHYISIKKQKKSKYTQRHVFSFHGPYRKFRVDRCGSGTCRMYEVHVYREQVWKWKRSFVFVLSELALLSLCGHPAWLCCVIWVVIWGMCEYMCEGGVHVSVRWVDGIDRKL